MKGCSSKDGTLEHTDIESLPQLKIFKINKSVNVTTGNTSDERIINELVSNDSIQTIVDNSTEHIEVKQNKSISTSSKTISENKKKRDKNDYKVTRNKHSTERTALEPIVIKCSSKSKTSPEIKINNKSSQISSKHTNESCIPKINILSDVKFSPGVKLEKNIFCPPLQIIPKDTESECILQDKNSSDQTTLKLTELISPPLKNIQKQINNVSTSQTSEQTKVVEISPEKKLSEEPENNSEKKPLPDFILAQCQKITRDVELHFSLSTNDSNNSEYSNESIENNTETTENSIETAEKFEFVLCDCILNHVDDEKTFNLLTQNLITATTMYKDSSPKSDSMEPLMYQCNHSPIQISESEDDFVEEIPLEHEEFVMSDDNNDSASSNNSPEHASTSQEDAQSSVNLFHSSKKRRRAIWNPRNVGDCRIEDLKDPVIARRNWNMAVDEISRLRNKTKVLNNKTKRLQNRIVHLQNNIKELKYMKHHNHQENKNTLPALLMERIMSNNSKRNYPDALREFSLTLYCYSPRAYNYVRKTLGKSLPSSKNFVKWCREKSRETVKTSRATRSTEPEEVEENVEDIENVEIIDNIETNENDVTIIQENDNFLQDEIDANEIEFLDGDYLELLEDTEVLNATKSIQFTDVSSEPEYLEEAMETN